MLGKISVKDGTFYGDPIYLRVFSLNVFIFSFICNKNSGWQLLLFSFLEMLARVLG